MLKAFAFLTGTNLVTITDFPFDSGVQNGIKVINTRNAGGGNVNNGGVSAFGNNNWNTNNLLIKYKHEKNEEDYN